MIKIKEFDDGGYYEVKEYDLLLGIIGDGLRGEGYVFSPRVDVDMEEYLTHDAISAINDKMEELSDD